MVKKAKRKRETPSIKPTDWNVGQPLAFPPPTKGRIARAAAAAVEEGLRGPSAKPRKRKKK
jgi:hypothetical protein